VDLLQLRREMKPNHSTYRHILTDVMYAEEIENMNSEFLVGKKYFGKQVTLAKDGKVLRETLDDQQNGTFLLATYLSSERIVLIEVAVGAKASEIPAALKMRKQIDLRTTVVMEVHSIPKGRFPYRI
jgi:hypothetical protein